MDLNDLHLLKASPVPLWSQIRAAILSKIVTKAWEPDTQLPAETAIANALDVSRATVRKALESLERDGLIIRTRGRGSFVAPGTTTEIGFPPLGFYQRMTARGHKVRSKVLYLEKTHPTVEEVEGLQLRADDYVLHLRRLRYLDGDPVLISSNHLVYELCQGIEDEDLSSGSLWARITRKTGLRVAGGIHTFEAVMPSAEEQTLLGISAQTPLLKGHGINYLADGTAFERSTVKIVGHRSFVRVRYSYVRRPPFLPEDEVEAVH
jgi:GntR family transcriptional regulator